MSENLGRVYDDQECSGAGTYSSPHNPLELGLSVSDSLSRRWYRLYDQQGFKLFILSILTPCVSCASVPVLCVSLLGDLEFIALVHVSASRQQFAKVG